MHGSSHEGMVLSCVCSLMLWALYRVKHHDSNWRHVSYWWDVHRSHVGDMSCLRMCFFPVVYDYLPI